MIRGEYRERLEILRDAALTARDILGDQIHGEGRNPTGSELDTLGQLLDKANGYQSIINEFYRTIVVANPPGWVMEALY